MAKGKGIIYINTLDTSGVTKYHYYMSKTPISKTQIRALAILGLPTMDGYKEAGALLETANAPFDGIPAGHNWRSAAKLTDEQFRAALGAQLPEASPSWVNLIEVGY